MNKNIKEKIRSQLKGQKSKKTGHCINCGKQTTYDVDFNKELVTCCKCNLETPIPDSYYEDIYKQFKKAGITLN